MAPVKELLNVVVNCEIWGRLRCAAASIGYRWRIRKGFVHSVLKSPALGDQRAEERVPAGEAHGVEVADDLPVALPQRGLRVRRMPVVVDRPAGARAGRERLSSQAITAPSPAA